MGWLSDYWRCRKPMMIVLAVLNLCSLSTVLYLPQLTLWAIFILLFLSGVFNTGVGIGYALSGEINPKRVSGVSVAFANMSSVIIGALSQPLIGKILDTHVVSKTASQVGSIAKSIHHYTPDGFKTAMIILPVSLGLAIIAAFFIKETHCQRVFESST